MSDKLHSGHRKRMYDKFLEQGPTAFATYELLEMLLYSKVKSKDTNPLSKLILKTFVDINGVLRASKEDFLKINSVGEKLAEVLEATKTLSHLIQNDSNENTLWSRGDDLHKIGKLFVDFFSGESGYCVALMSLDNQNKVINIEKLYDLDYKSGAVRPQRFIDYALKNGASSVAIAHSHPYPPLLASEGDIETNKLVVDSLARINISVIEHFIVCQNEYAPIMSRSRNALFGAKDFCGYEGEETEERRKFLKVLHQIISSIADVELSDLESAVLRSPNLEHFLSQSEAALSTLLNIELKKVIYFKIMTELCLRAITERFKAGKSYGDDEIASLLKAKFYTKTRESVCMLSFDKNHRFLAIDSFGEGTVNYSNIIPRLTMEKAIARGAKIIYIAHNHPFGNPYLSSEDLGAFNILDSIYAHSDIVLEKSIVVACNKAAIMNMNDKSIQIL